MDAGEDGGILLGVGALLLMAEGHDEFKEVGGVVALEAEDELMVVEAERVGGVNLDGGETVTDGEVLVHEALAFFAGQLVPPMGLGEGVYEEVGTA